MDHIKTIALIVSVGLFSACSYTVAHRPFVASSYEPVLVERKGSLSASLGLRPIKYGYGDLTYAPFSNLALRLNAGGTNGLSNLSGSAVYFQNLNKFGFFGGGLYNFQSNQIKRRLGNLSGTFFKNINYSCIYHSVGIVGGLTLKSNKGAHHFIVKSQYNYVQSYYYDFRRYDRYNYTMNEQLSYAIPDFFSIEPSYSLVLPIKDQDSHFVKFQVSGVFAQKTLRHHYLYNWIAPYTGGTQIHEATSLHPVVFPLNFSFSFVFSSTRRKE